MRNKKSIENFNAGQVHTAVDLIGRGEGGWNGKVVE
jgi:hypothetical protein